MSAPRDLVELADHLRSAGFDLFAPGAEARLSALPAARGILGLDSSQKLTCLRALAIQRSELEPGLLDAEFVATLPSDVKAGARPTGLVIRDMLEGSHREIIALGYEITDGSVIEQLIRAVRSGASLTLICDRANACGQVILDRWPADMLSRPQVFQDRVRADAAPHASMHSKALLVDGEDLLITSANFTFHGLKGNIELGVRLRGRPALKARDILKEILASGTLDRL